MSLQAGPTFRILVRKLPQQYTVGDTKDRGARAYSKGDRYDRGDGEDGILA
jgi:hypothetical protein